MTVLIEMIVKRRMDRGEFLQRLGTPEFCHRAFKSTESLMGVFRPIIEPTARRLALLVADHFHGCSIRAEAIGYHFVRIAVLLHRLFQECQGRPRVALSGNKRFKDAAFMVDCTSKVVRSAVDTNENVLEVPPPLRRRAHRC